MAGPAPVLPPRPNEAWTPERVEPVPGTEFALVQLRVAPITSGLATGSLIAGIAAILVSTLVLCFGLIGLSDGWGAVVAGAFALLGVLIGGGAAGVGLAARRQIRRSGQDGRVRFVGRGVTTAGICCGFAGLGISALTLLLILVLQFS
ncbi:hypothetical protein GCM10020358_03540 [Amorphoplanes nipponensis]|uniref:DUF4190 domain-containing protein n=2 Tax=Actinoplanes nipponensis TaxID=135950 RepID=A0A919JQU3_9ACTN|nr:hypothetical protein Ani05nite_76170 [Actinoplanes nipponensis]